MAYLVSARQTSEWMSNIEHIQVDSVMYKYDDMSEKTPWSISDAVTLQATCLLPAVVFQVGGQNVLSGVSWRKSQSRNTRNVVVACRQ